MTACIHFGNTQITYPVLAVAKDNSFIVVSEGPGLTAIVRNDQKLGSWTFDGKKVKIELR